MKKVKGYKGITEKKGYELLFLVNESGEIKSCLRKFSSKFFNKKDNWVACEKLPVNSKFIGNYNII